MAISEKRLTKKQLKAERHRNPESRADRKKKQAKQLEANALPEVDEEDGPIVTEGSSKDVEQLQDANLKTKSKKRARSDIDEDSPTKKARYICFCGNLPYNATADQISAHFKHNEEKPAVRLRTTSKPDTDSAKKRGFAFLEFETPSALQNALRLHHTILDKRKLNVELTAGGAGNSEQRRAKLKDRNKRLSTQREKRNTNMQKNKDVKAQAKAQELEKSEKPALARAAKQPKYMLSGANAIKLA